MADLKTTNLLLSLGLILVEIHVAFGECNAVCSFFYECLIKKDIDDRFREILKQVAGKEKN